MPRISMRLTNTTLILSSLLLCGAIACSSDSPAPADTTSATDGGVTDSTPTTSLGDGATDTSADTAGPSCNTAGATFKPGLVELSSFADPGTPAGTLRSGKGSITLGTTVYVLNEQVLNEAVRFELKHPAKVHGFSVQWGGIMAELPGTAPLTAGLYQDMGYNGFDFWHQDPYWTGSRCNADAPSGTWVNYVLDKPLDVAQPGLIWVTHNAPPGTPAFAFGAESIKSCDLFDTCHSAINLPLVGGASAFGGTSTFLGRNYLVKLYVEYTEQIEPKNRLFQPIDASPTASRAAFGDYDNDGWDDLVLDGPRLLHNVAGKYVDATASAGITAMGVKAGGGIWGDVDNDGCLDLLLFIDTATDAPSLLKQDKTGGVCKGTFTNITAGSGITTAETYYTCGTDPTATFAPSAAASFIDLDADGLLDIFFANYECGGVDDSNHYISNVFHNLGRGKFEDWTATHGFSDLRMAGRGGAPIDHDGDGWTDLFVNNYRLEPNFFFLNARDGSVIENAGPAGLAGRAHAGGTYGHSIGAAWGDLDNDGLFDLVVANLAHPRFFNISDKTQVLMQQKGHTFKDITGDWKTPHSAAGLRYQETHSVPALADFDHDGNLDLIITAVYEGRPTDFYWGVGDGTFKLDAYHAGFTTTNGWGIGLSDIDNDGDVDAFVTTLFSNVSAAAKGHWLQVRVVGDGIKTNTSAIGSTVQVTTGSSARIRHVQGGTGQGNQDSAYLHFGLGAATSVDNIKVTFPGTGRVVNFSGPFKADQRIWVYQDGHTHVGWAP